MSNKGEIIKDDKGKADILNSFFASVFTKEDKQIHNRVLYEIRDEIARPLTDLFRYSLDTGELPSNWKVANITPICKKSRKVDPINYRPVSLTSAVCKMMKRLVRDELENHLEKTGVAQSLPTWFQEG